MGICVPAGALLRFWAMLAHYHRNIWNAAERARSLGVSEPTVRRYLDFLTGLFMVRQLQPWHENLKKRQVKMPQLYPRDSGLLRQLLGSGTDRDLLNMAGAAMRSWRNGFQSPSGRKMTGVWLIL